jgi:oligopeptide/dipeptide ABC transporter ATP-binding protein
MAEPILQTVDLTKIFSVRRGFFGQQRLQLVAVDHVNLAINEGETLGLVGESGCGKSTLALTLMRLYEPTHGRIIFEGKDLTGLDDKQMKIVRRQMQMIFQDPFASLDPRLSIARILREPLDIHGIGSVAERQEKVRQLLEVVSLSADTMDRFPSEFSGGQQQRIGIARALALQPKLLICDEPVSSLDVSVQAQLLNLLRDLQAEFRLTYLFISHNIAVTAFMSRRIGVMYLGRLVEIAPSRQLVEQPRHPYTQALVAAVPEADPVAVPVGREHRYAVTGDIPSPIDRPPGCPFHPRCPLAEAICAQEEPLLRLVDTDQYAACHFA